MVYEGKHAKRGAAEGAENHDGAYGPDDNTAPRQPDEAMSIPDVTLDSLEEEESQHSDDNHAHMQRLLGSIHLQAVSQADEAEPMPDIAGDSLEEEESQDGDGSYERMQHLLGSIHLQGIRLQSPIYFQGSQRLRTAGVQETSSPNHQNVAPRQEHAASQVEDAASQDDAASQEDDAASRQDDDMLRDDTVILMAVERPPRDGYPEAGVGEEAPLP